MLIVFFRSHLNILFIFSDTSKIKKTFKAEKSQANSGHKHNLKKQVKIHICVDFNAKIIMYL